MVKIFSTHTTTTIIMARHIDDNNGDDGDALHTRVTVMIAMHTMMMMTR